VNEGSSGIARGAAVVSQEVFPNDYSADGSDWKVLGDFDITGSSLVVQLTSTSDNLTYVVADAIRVERIGDLPTAAEAQVTEGGADVPDGVGIVEFGTVELNHPLTKTFTISNTGDATLNLSGPVSVPDGYTLVTPPVVSTINSGQATTFQVRLDAALPGTYTGEASFATDDPNEDPFNFAITGTVLATQIVDDQSMDSSSFRRNGLWGDSVNGVGRDGDFRFAVDATDNETASWRFNVTPGQYRVAATWAENPDYFASNALFSVLDKTITPHGEAQVFLPFVGFPESGIAVHDGDLYVVEGAHWRVNRYDGATGAPKPSPGNTGAVFASGLNWPAGIAFGPDGNLYVGQHDDSSVVRFDSNGVPLGTFVVSGSGGLSGAGGLRFGPDGNLYVVSQRNDLVMRYRASDGQPLPSTGNTGAVFAVGDSSNYFFNLTFDRDGKLYLTNYEDNGQRGGQVVRFDADGSNLAVFVASSAGGLNNPAGIDFGPDGDVYVSSYNTDQVLQFDGLTGEFVQTVISDAEGARGVTFGPDGRLFVASLWGNNVLVLGPISASRDYVAGNASLDQRLAPNDFADAGSIWENFGAVYNIAGNRLVVELTAQGADGYVIADGVRIERIGDLPNAPEVQVADADTDLADNMSMIDFGAVEFSAPVIKTFTIANSGGADLILSAPVSVPAGYSLVTPPALTTLAAGQTTTFQVRLNATLPGTYTGQISLATNDSDEDPFNFTVAGSVLANRILDDGQPGFTQTGSFQTFLSPIGRDGDYRYAVGGAVASEAVWTFNVTPGRYQVAATWFDTMGSIYFAENSLFTIFDLGTPVASVPVNQRFGPNDFTASGSNWELVAGVLNITGSTLSVRLSHIAANGYVLADAIRIERVGDLNSAAVDEVLGEEGEQQPTMLLE
jgi:streptogramin lyase